MAPRRGSHAPAESQPEDVHTITGAQAPHSEGIDHRMKRYALQMGLRIVCLIIAVMFDGWIRWVAVAGVAILPWVAVVLANGTDRAEVKDVSYAPGDQPRELTPLPMDEATSNPADSEKKPEDTRADAPSPEARRDSDGDDVIEGEFRSGHGSSRAE